MLFVAIAIIIVFIVVFSYIGIEKELQRRKKHFLHDLELLHSVTNENRGTYLERDCVLRLLKKGVPSVTIFHDLYVPKRGGGYSQVDLVVVTSVGIIVVEVKDYRGWIYGNGRQQKWTQVLAYGREKYRFYNPIIQNRNHIYALKGLSKQFENLPYFNVVVFSNHSELQELNFIPHNTYVTKASRLYDVIEDIKQNNQLANYTNKREIVDILRDIVEIGNSEEIADEHVRNLNDEMGRERIYN